MANVLINYSNNTRYAVDELTSENLYSFRGLGHEFSKKIATDVAPSIIEHIDIYDTDRQDLADQILAFAKDKNIDILFPLYNDMLFPYLYEYLGFTKKQKNILCDKQVYTDIARSLGIPVPRTYTDIRKAEYPIIAKPVNGTGSIGIKVLKDYSEYFFFASGEDIQYNDLGKHYIFQDFIDGMTISCAGRVVNNTILFDISYTIESSPLPYRAEVGFILMPNLDVDDVLKNHIAKLIGKLELDNCVWMADFIFSNGEFYLVDFSPRLSVSAQVLIKYSSNINYNQIVLDSLLRNDKTEINLKKCVVFRYFDIPKGEASFEYLGDDVADELVLPADQSYMTRLDLLMNFKGYAVTSDVHLNIAEEKWKIVSQGIREKSVNTI